VTETSVLVLTKNEADNIKRCLESIFSQESDREFEVVVVDSGSTDATVEIAKGYPVRIEQIRPESFHHARTRNFAATLASGDVLVYLAADAIPASKKWLQFLVANFVNPGVGAVYGRQLPKAGSSPERLVALSSLYGDSRIVKCPDDRVMLGYKYYHFSTVNAAIRKATWAATKFPDDFKVFEDVAIAKRILDSGWTIVYEPEAAVIHSHDYPFRTLFKRYFDIGVVYQRLGIWNKNSRRAVRKDGWQALRKKIGSLARHEGIARTAASILKDVTKYAAIELGRNERVLPRSFKKRLSQFGLFD
jgi:glycosyltransferase involved in cell wall biosynthesis